jgi:hypothetical protein
MFSAELHAQKLWGKLKPGIHPVGFKTIRQTDPSRNNRPIVLSIWYPAKRSEQKISFKDYLYSGILNEKFTAPSPEEKQKSAKDLRETIIQLEFSGVTESSLQNFESVLDMPMAAEKDAPVAAGKFPTILMGSEPESMAVTAEWLASQGFVVAAIHTPYNMVMPPEHLIWDAQTRDMVWLAEYSKKIEFIDQTKIAAMGFGGGIISAFLFSMKTTQLKALVNLEGAVFHPFSMVTKSTDYHPEKMNTPMLHIITEGTKRNESEAEIKAINAPLHRLLVVNNRISHQDFSIFGRIVNQGLSLRNDIAADAEAAYLAAHQLILGFLNSHLNNTGKFTSSTMNGVFKIEQ